jgi:hypothetical protein
MKPTTAHHRTRCPTSMGSLQVKQSPKVLLAVVTLSNFISTDFGMSRPNCDAKFLRLLPADIPTS